MLIGVVATGAVLAAGSAPLSPLQWLKIGAGLAAIAANVHCLIVVVRRHAARDDPAALRRHSRAPGQLLIPEQSCS